MAPVHSPQREGPASLREIIAATMPHHEGLSDSAEIVVVDQEGEATGAVEIAFDRNPEWLIHQTDLLRSPLYRTERGDGSSQPGRSYVLDRTQDGQLILGYPYDEQTELRSTLGELNCRDMLVMSVIQQTFHGAGCPQSCMLTGPSATLYHLADQVGLSGGEATNLVKASLDRLSIANVKMTFRNVERAKTGGYPVNTRGEIVFGFISGYGWRERSTRGRKEAKVDSYIRLDQTLGDLIRHGHFTFLRAGVLRKLHRKPVALKLYGWARTHNPNERGFLLPHRTSTLADKIGCQDTNVTRRRKKVMDGLEAVCSAAPDEFPGFEIKQGTERSADPVVLLRRRKVALGAATRVPAITAAAS